MKKFSLLLLMLLICSTQLKGQSSRIDSIAVKLDLLSSFGVSLDQTITIAFDGPIKDLISFLSETAKLNLTVLPGLEGVNSSVSFTDARLKDVIIYLCRAHQLDIQITGKIISFGVYTAPPLPPPPVLVKMPDIFYDSVAQLLTLNLEGDTLDKVVRKIISLTGKNIIIDPGARSVRVNGLIANVGLENALKQLAASNYLLLKRDPDFFKLEPKYPGLNPDQLNNTSSGSQMQTGVLQVQRTGGDQLNINASGTDILDIIQESAAQLGINYYLLSENGNIQIGNTQGNNGGYNNFQNAQSPGTPNSWGTVTVQFQQITFRDLLDQLFKNTNFHYKEQNGLFILGRRVAESMREYRIYQFQNRSINGVMPLIPRDLIYDVQVDTFPEQNSIILSGSRWSIEGITTFLKEVDKLIPVVLIEVILIDVEIDRLSDAGVEMGTVRGGVAPGGTIISSTADKGGFNFSFSPSAINRLLGLLSGRGIINLGQISPDFYLTLRAVQEEGYINIKSTPKLSTLNSHPATMSIGQTRYYQEQQVNYPGTDRPIPVQSQVFREVEANLDIKIIPIVSGDDQVTLNINYEQSEFLGESTVNSPPPRVSRKFESMIRVKNGEMVVLGGLETEAKVINRRGLPFLSRIPGLSWLFGRTKKTKQKDKILLFIKPTIIS